MLRQKPGLAKCSPERASVDTDVTVFFASLCKRYGVTAETLAMSLRCFRSFAPLFEQFLVTKGH